MWERGYPLTSFPLKILHLPALNTSLEMDSALNLERGHLCLPVPLCGTGKITFLHYNQEKSGVDSFFGFFILQPVTFSGSIKLKDLEFKASLNYTPISNTNRSHKATYTWCLNNHLPWTTTHCSSITEGQPLAPSKPHLPRRLHCSTSQHSESLSCTRCTLGVVV